jgi:putative hydrolase of the HAD superfamily
VLFDFGGVMAEEGFNAGLEAIAGKNGLDPDGFRAAATEIMYGGGYVVGRSDERGFWDAVRARFRIAGDDASLSEEITSRFVPRPHMHETVLALRAAGVQVALLSDQTDWLDELDRRLGVYGPFDRVFVSFHLGKSKRDPSLFDDVAAALGRAPGELLFIDDNAGHIGRAAGRGLKTIRYIDRHGFEQALRACCPGLPTP